MVCGPDEADRSFLKCRNAQLALTKSCKCSYIVYRDQYYDINSTVDKIARRRRENFGGLELRFLAILVFLELQNPSKFTKITNILRDFPKILSFA